MSAFSKTTVRPPRRLVQSLASITAAVAVVLSAACADAPTAATPAASASRLGVTSIAMHPSYSANGAAVMLGTFTIDPSQSQTFEFTGHKVQIAAGSVCDPAVTAYGAGEWDKPCTLATQPITLTVTATVDHGGHAVVQFSPDLRFAPDKVNTLWLTDIDASNRVSRINWCPTGENKCYHEAKSDPSVATQLDPATGLVFRRVKHFSGYNVVFDITSDATDLIL